MLNEIGLFSLPPGKSKHIIIVAFSQINKQDAERSTTLYSFEPEIISESEERKRVTALAQRDFLIKSYGLLEQIYIAMKRNGILRPADEKKYGLYGRLGLHANTNHSTCSSSHKSHHHQNDHLDTTQAVANQCPHYSLRVNEVSIYFYQSRHCLVSKNQIQIYKLDFTRRSFYIQRKVNLFFHFLYLTQKKR